MHKSIIWYFFVFILQLFFFVYFIFINYFSMMKTYFLNLKNENEKIPKYCKIYLMQNDGKKRERPRDKQHHRTISFELYSSTKIGWNHTTSLKSALSKELTFVLLNIFVCSLVEVIPTAIQHCLWSLLRFYTWTCLYLYMFYFFSFLYLGICKFHIHFHWTLRYSNTITSSLNVWVNDDVEKI